MKCIDNLMFSGIYIVLMVEATELETVYTKAEVMENVVMEHGNLSACHCPSNAL